VSKKQREEELKSLADEIEQNTVQYSELEE
jgi:hypothetical protein